MKLILLIASFCIGTVLSDNVASLGNYPYHASLWIHDEDYNRLCDGALIAQGWILTAAHCIYNATSIYVRLGTVNLMEGAEWYTYIDDQSHFYVDENFNSAIPYVNDIGLIHAVEMSASVIDGTYIRPIDILESTTTNLDYLQSTVTGFGPSRTSPETVLRYVTMPIMPNTWCQRQHGATRVTGGMMCTDTLNDESPCLEDSGAPLTATVAGQNVIVGIGSTWTETCTYSHHGIFTRVAPHASWIRRIIASAS
ncbi:hypothetical protein PVAND_017545 [Polypedilum vanderplanki]|uniref:Peptidase S1 domain-containing protein n=1 Tax=Polypedilum vanderplanki TaxID=319348 RepID=A0A9J6BJU7_POLVA|nr:hypothetical protein PVAND_017545 [Polypedilum vanderplanki]